MRGYAAYCEGSTPNLFADAKFGKHAVEHVLARDDARHRTERARRGVEVARDELRRRGRRESRFGPLQLVDGAASRVAVPNAIHRDLRFGAALIACERTPYGRP